MDYVQCNILNAFQTAVVENIESITSSVSSLTTQEAHCSFLSSNDMTLNTRVITDSLTATNASVQSVTTNDLFIGTLNCDVLNVTNLITSEYVVSNLFASQILAAAQAEAAIHTASVQNSQSATLNIIKIVLLSVAAAIAVVAIGVLAFGVYGALIAAAPAVVAGGGGLIGGGLSVAASAAADIGVYSAVAAAGSASIGFATIMTMGTVIAATSVAALTVASLIHNPPPANGLRSISTNATYGNAFVSDIIFGTTTYVDTSATDGFVDYLLIQNELHTTYSLARIISYNPQLQAFDDTTSYDSLSAYLSLATIGPTFTLRFNEDGNLAIYSSPASGPVWQSGTQVSSIKYKENVKTIDHPLEKILKLDGIYFNYLDENVRQVGLIAQQVKEVFEFAVFGREESGYRLRMERLIPLILESMKELYIKQEELLK